MLKLNGYFTSKGLKKREEEIKEIKAITEIKPLPIADIRDNFFNDYELVTAFEYDRVSKVITLTIEGDVNIPAEDITITAKEIIECNPDTKSKEKESEKGRYIHTYLYEHGQKANNKGYKVYDIENITQLKNFVKDFGITCEVVPNPKFVDKMHENALRNAAYSIIKKYNNQDSCATKNNKLFISNSREV